MQECEINPCVKQEYESELTPSTTGFNLVERMTPQTIPNQNTIYSNGDDLFVWDGEKYVPLVGRGCNLPLDIQLYGTWTGQLDEMVYEGSNESQQTNTEIDIKNAPDDLIYFFVTIECDGDYADDVDLVADNVWSGVSTCIVSRNSSGVTNTVAYMAYAKSVRPQTISEIVSAYNSGITTGISVIGYQNVIYIDRSVFSYGAKRIMGGNYTVNVYGLKLGNFQ